MEYTFAATVKSVSRSIADVIDEAGDVVHIDRSYWGVEGEIGAVSFNALANLPAPPVGTRFQVTLVAIEEE